MTQGMSIADVEELENRLMALAGRRVFMEYTKANGQRTERTVKIVRVKDRKVTVWCEKRNGLRSFNLSGIGSLMPLASTTKVV